MIADMTPFRGPSMGVGTERSHVGDQNVATLHMCYANAVDVVWISFVACMYARHRIHGKHALKSVAGAQILLRLARFGAKNVWAS